MYPFVQSLLLFCQCPFLEEQCYDLFQGSVDNIIINSKNYVIKLCTLINWNQTMVVINTQLFKVYPYVNTEMSQIVFKSGRVLTLLNLCLTLSWRRSLSYRNQSIDFQSKRMDWFLYDRDLRSSRRRSSGKNYPEIIDEIHTEITMLKSQVLGWSVTYLKVQQLSENCRICLEKTLCAVN